MGTSVIDAFVATLGLDGTMFNRGMNDAARAQKKLDDQLRRNDSDRTKREKVAADARKRQQREEEEGAKRTERAVKAVRNELLGMAAIFTAGMGIKGFIQNTINSAAGLGYLSANLQQSTKELTSWQRASERANGSSEGIVAQLKESADTLAQLRAGLGPNEGLQNFFRWGGKSDELKDGNTYLLARSRIIADMFKVDPAKAALVAKGMGISDDQFDFLKQGPAAVMALVQAQEKNAVIAEKDAAAALELKNKMLDLRDSLQATTVKILTALLPSLNKFADWILSMTEYITKNRDVIAGWVERLVNADWSGMIDSAKSFADSLKSIAKSMQEVLDRWDEWMGKPKIKAPGVTYLPGAFKFGKPEDMAEDARLHGRKVDPNLGRPKNATLARINDVLDEGWHRTLASLGVQNSKEWVRDHIGRDDYNAGPKKAVGSPATAAGKTRGIRNNNPGNIEYGSFARSNGASGSDGRFAQFGSSQAGLDAMANLLRSYGARGINSIDAIVSRYAPGHENNTRAYAAAVSRRMGIKGGIGLDLNDPKIMKDLMAAMVQQENGTNPYSDDMLQMAAIGKAQRAANANAAGAMPSGAAASLRRGGATSTNTSTVTVENITVNTAATDAVGIAKDMRPAVEKYTFSTQANTGMR